MDMNVHGTRVYAGGQFTEKPLAIRGGVVVPFSPSDTSMAQNFLFSNCIVIPGLTDVHVHFREPGFSYKETVATGSRAAAAGGYTAVCTMPNLKPAPDCDEGLAVQEEAIRRDGRVRIYPYGTITRGSLGLELSDMETLAPRVIGFTDDGRGVQSEEMMRSAMVKARSLGRIIAAHCEDERLIGGCVHDGEFAKRSGLPGIPSESEWGPLARDLRLVAETGCAYHVCHVSCKESVDLIRRAKAAGLDVTAETAPHYLLLTDGDIKEENARFKMNPPLRAEADREALIEGLLDGTIDMIATDHAPHTEEEKSLGFLKSPMGVVGLECAFGVLYTDLVKKGVLSLETLIDRMAIAPRRRFGIPGGCEVGDEADLAVFDLEARRVITGRDFESMGKVTPFEGKEIFGACRLTAVKGEIAWLRK